MPLWASTLHLPLGKSSGANASAAWRMLVAAWLSRSAVRLRIPPNSLDYSCPVPSPPPLSLASSRLAARAAQRPNQPDSCLPPRLAAGPLGLAVAAAPWPHPRCRAGECRVPGSRWPRPSLRKVGRSRPDRLLVARELALTTSQLLLTDRELDPEETDCGGVAKLGRWNRATCRLRVAAVSCRVLSEEAETFSSAR